MSAELTSLLLRVSADLGQRAEELFAVKSQLTGAPRMAAGHYAVTALNLSRGVKDLADALGPPPAPPTSEQDQSMPGQQSDQDKGGAGGK